MQIAFKHKEKKLSEAQKFAKILTAKWRVRDKAKAEIDVKELIKNHPFENTKALLSNTNPLGELERLTDLLDRGLINESEFNTLKNRIFNT